MRSKITTVADKEYAAELLKERIYATLALLAVLVSIDTEHSTAFHAGLIVIGTIVSLWAASLVAAQMSRRVVYQGELDRHTEHQHQLRKHAPMLASLVFPVFMLSLAMIKLISLQIAIEVSIASALLLLVGWSVMSARSLKVSVIPTTVLVVTEVLIGLAVVALKLVTGH